MLKNDFHDRTISRYASPFLQFRLGLISWTTRLPPFLFSESAFFLLLRSIVLPFPLYALLGNWSFLFALLKESLRD